MILHVKEKGLKHVLQSLCQVISETAIRYSDFTQALASEVLLF